MTPRKLKAAIFDLDGVLVDTAKYHYEAWKKIADELNIPFDPEKNEALKGLSRRDSLDALLSLGNKTYSETEKDKLCDQKNEYYLESIRQVSPKDLLPGVDELLLELKEKKIPLAIGSSSKNARVIIEKLGIKNYFTAIVDGNDLTKAKPDPQVYLLAGEDLKVRPESCVVFEDGYVGIVAAKRAGMVAVGLGSVQTLKEADYYFENLKDTKKITNLFK